MILDRVGVGWSSYISFRVTTSCFKLKVKVYVFSSPNGNLSLVEIIDVDWSVNITGTMGPTEGLATRLLISSQSSNTGSSKTARATESHLPDVAG